MVWGFTGNRYARWRSVLPNRWSFQPIGAEIRSMIRRRPFEYLGRSPISRISVTIIFVLLLLEAGSGLVRAGTDLYYPPFGGVIVDFLAKPGVDPDTITMQTGREAVIGYRLKYIHQLQGLTGFVHSYSAYLLMGMIVLHISGAALSEIRQRSGVVSAMFSGKKSMSGPPIDADDSDEEIDA
jgi:cytochrome b